MHPAGLRELLRDKGGVKDHLFASVMEVLREDPKRADAGQLLGEHFA